MEFVYGLTRVVIRDGWVETTLPDGATVYAMPMWDEESVARAHELGYRGDVWAMTRDHDRLHARLCHALGLEESPALRGALDGSTSLKLAQAEECVVLAAQRYLNLCIEAGFIGPTCEFRQPAMSVGEKPSASC